eukprot:7041042-Alexandrium_andersonii.AAC.1
MLDGVRCYNVLAEGVGRPCTKLRSLPQGCALSMLWVALLSPPAARLVRPMGAIPRFPADDWAIIAVGDS